MNTYFITNQKHGNKYDDKKRLKKETKKNVVQVRLNDEEAKQLGIIAQKTGMTKSEVMRTALKQARIIIFPDADKLLNTLSTISQAQNYLFNSKGNSDYYASCKQFNEAKKVLDDAGKAVVNFMEEQIKSKKIIGGHGNGNTTGI